MKFTTTSKAKTTAKPRPKSAAAMRVPTPEQAAIAKAEIDRFARQDAADAVWDRVAARNAKP